MPDGMSPTPALTQSVFILKTLCDWVVNEQGKRYLPLTLNILPRNPRARPAHLSSPSSTWDPARPQSTSTPFRFPAFLASLTRLWAPPCCQLCSHPQRTSSPPPLTCASLRLCLLQLHQKPCICRSTRNSLGTTMSIGAGTSCIDWQIG